MAGKTITVAIMDAPYESANSTTALRIVQSALAKGHNVNVFAYEGAVNLTMKAQAPHPNPVGHLGRAGGAPDDQGLGRLALQDGEGQGRQARLGELRPVRG